MRESKERLGRNNPQSNQGNKNPSFVIHKTHPERNRSQHLRRAKLETETDSAVEYLVPNIGFNDRESLQETILSLKVEMNAINNENIKLRSKVMLLEKQAEKLRMVVDNKIEQRPKQPKELHRLCNTLKDRLRQRNAEYEFLETQHTNLKKSIKKTRITQMQIQNQNLLVELQKMAKLYLQLAEYKQKTAPQRQEWKKALDTLKERNHYIKMLQNEVERLQKVEQDLNKEMDEVKNKLENADQKRIKETNQLKRIIKTLSNSGEPLANHNPQPVKASYRPTPRQTSERRKTTQEQKSQRQSKDLKGKDVSKAQPAPAPQKSQPLSNKQPQLKPAPLQPIPASQLKKKEPKLELKFEQKPQPIPEVKPKAQQNDDTYKWDEDSEKQPIDQQDDYGAEYDQQAQEQSQQNHFQDVIEFMVYRLKANKISRSKVISMVENSNTKSLEQFSRFIEKEPFGIKQPEDNQLVMTAITTDLINVKDIKQKFIDMIPQYELWQASEQTRMEAHIKSVLKKNAVSINDVLSQYEDSQHSVSKQVLASLLVDLQPQQIEYVVAKLSLRSLDINHLNHKELTELFLQNDDYEEDDFQPQHDSIKKQPADVQLSDGSYEQL